MTLTELTFGLSALILGLSLTHLAAAFSKLLLARERVRWAPEPLLQAILVLLVVILVWLSQWEERGLTPLVYWRVLLQKLSYLSLYVAASVCLPEVPPAPAEIDLGRFYDRTRRLSFGALIVSIFLINAYYQARTPTASFGWTIIPRFIFCVPYALLMFVRQRWFNVLLLALVLLAFGTLLLTYQIDG